MIHFQSLKKSNPAVQTLLHISEKDPEIIRKSLLRLEQHFSSECHNNVEMEKILRPSDDELAFGGVESAFAATLSLANILRANAFDPVDMEKQLSSFGLQESFVKKFLSVIGSRNGSPSTSHLPRFSSCQWSLDVAISSSRMLKLLEPSVTLKIFCESKSMDQFQMSVQEFSLLRFKVAEALKILFDIQKKKPYTEKVF